MKVIYDYDPDGCSSAYLIRSAFEKNLFDSECEADKSIEFIVGDHGDDSNIKECLQRLQPDETVFILDFSIDPKLMDQFLAATLNVFWIDHHKSSIEKYDDYDKRVPGRRDMDYASVENTFFFLFGKNRPMPPMVKLIGDFDTWRWHENNDRSPLQFIYGIQVFDINPESDNWKDFDVNYEKYLEFGKVIDLHKKQEYLDFHEKFFEIEFEGHKTLVFNTPTRGALPFDDYPQRSDYDVLLIFHWNGKSYSFSIFSVDDKVDVSEIAAKYGGGGHAGASGFTLKELPFKLK